TAMAIDPGYQRQGIGTALVGAAEEFARSRGCVRMEVTSGDRREKDAHVFYAGLGYASDCRRFLKRFEQTQS
ncbi:MAG: GNAT family N-acetyltransferase, partial [Roseimicrobium sp.]